jgi:hypothetical protein
MDVKNYKCERKKSTFFIPEFKWRGFGEVVGEM